VKYSNRKQSKDAVGVIKRAKRGNSLNFALVDSKGNLCDVESTPKGVDYLFTDEDYYVHTNHFLLFNSLKKIKTSTFLN